MAHAHAHAADPADPHGDLEGHHGHVIIPVSTLLGVLVVLLFFTVLTVAASRAEVWIASTFNVNIPQSVNVGIAVSIAVIKSILVASFFMQLKYDSAVNTLVFLFCLFAFALFLFITMTDLGARSVVYPYKAGEVIRGGTGNVKWANQPFRRDIKGPVYEFAAKEFTDRVGPAEVAVVREDIMGGHEPGGHGPLAPSTANQSRPARGLTGALDPVPAGAAEPHGEH
ncbi:MAG: cytochrome C oxidase subunit IV family protein [Phycisphaerales bacterium]|nr:cytochrome C oxidase subunit IV family protein [Phycisphaerales bacterium]